MQRLIKPWHTVHALLSDAVFPKAFSVSLTGAEIPCNRASKPSCARWVLRFGPDSLQCTLVTVRMVCESSAVYEQNDV